MFLLFSNIIKMGCSSDKNALTKSIKYGSNSSNSKTHNDKSIISFDINAVSLDLSNNLNVYNNFIRFCEKNSFPKLTYLNLRIIILKIYQI